MGSIMKFKLFSFSSSDALEKAVNEWMSNTENYEHVVDWQVTESAESITITIRYQ